MRKSLIKILGSLPPRVRITPKVSYEILFIERFDDDEKCVGQTRYETKQIVIKKNESLSLTFRTVLHEIIHAINFEYELDLTERHVLGLEKGIFTVFRINKLLDLISKTL